MNALAKLYSKVQGREIDPTSNVSFFLIFCDSDCLNSRSRSLHQVLVTVGAYSALSHAIQGFVQKGDEVHYLGLQSMGNSL